MKYLKVLYVQVIIGIVTGVTVGWLFPSFAPIAKLISEMFINMIRMVIAPVIFFTIVLGIAGAGNLNKVGRVGGKGLIYFEIVTTVAIIIGLVVANLVKPGIGVTHNSIAGANVAAIKDTKGFDWADFILHIVPANIADAFARGDIIQILFFGILFSIGLKQLGSYGESVIATFEKLNKVLFNILKIIMKVSPLGAFGGMAYTIGKFGFTTLLLLGKLMLTFYITALLFIFVVLNLIARVLWIQLMEVVRIHKSRIAYCFGLKQQ
ncbi:MAG: cation:dicarboxylase symporter family transporter [Segetibacter sp.]